MSVRVRFAPSPTGQIHIGNIRTAVFNWLFARSQGGKFLLRVEDTDQERSSEEFEEIILKELRWLGLDIDEGIGGGGEYGPYRQTHRLKIYKKYAEELQEKGCVFPCFCSPDEFEKEKNPEHSYNDPCRDLSPDKVEELRNKGVPEALRFRSPRQGKVSFLDSVHGEIAFQSQVIDDFALMKSTGYPTYNFACVVDDHLMKISHVLRGEDHISNTPKQILIYEAMGWQPPVFAHLPLILDKKRRRLKKRSGQQEAFLSSYRNAGYLPETVFNYLALLGWSPGEDKEIMSREEMVEKFSLEKINESGAVFDIEKIKWMNGVYLRNLERKEFRERALAFLSGQGLDTENEKLIFLMEALQEKVNTLKELAQKISEYFEPLAFPDPEDARQVLQQDGVEKVLSSLKAKVGEVDDLNPDRAANLLKEIIKELQVGGKLVYKPVRYALTGKGTGADLSAIMAYLGPENIRMRIDETFKFLKGDSHE